MGGGATRKCTSIPRARNSQHTQQRYVVLDGCTDLPLLWFMTFSRSSSLCSLNFRLNSFIGFLCCLLTPSPTRKCNCAAVSAREVCSREFTKRDTRARKRATLSERARSLACLSKISMVHNQCKVHAWVAHTVAHTPYLADADADACMHAAEF